MHREHPVEDLRRNKIVVRMHQLDANDHRFEPSDDQIEQSVGDVKNADPFVIDRGHPLVNRLRPCPAGILQVFNGDRVR